jgi:hypothetical protein
LIQIELYDNHMKRVIYESSLKVELFGFTNPEKTSSLEITNKVKAIFSRLHLTGDPQNDFNV